MARLLLGVAVLVAVVATLAIGASAALDRPSRTATTTMLVDAQREDVWRVVTQFDTYAEWNPYMRIEGGPPAVGSSIDVRLDPEGDERELDATIFVYKPPRKLRWQSRLLVPGVMDVEYEIIVAPVSPGVTQVTQHAREEGLLVPILGAAPTQAGLEMIGEALARRVEEHA